MSIEPSIGSSERNFFAEGASEIIQAIAVAMRAGVTMSQLQSTMAVHPTLGEELVTLRALTKIYDSQRS